LELFCSYYDQDKMNPGSLCYHSRKIMAQATIMPFGYVESWQVTDAETISKLNFVECELVTIQDFSRQIYKVLAARAPAYPNTSENYNLRLYLRPLQPYQSFEFQSLFGFGTDCKGYDSNRVVAVRQLDLDVITLRKFPASNC